MFKWLLSLLNALKAVFYVLTFNFSGLFRLVLYYLLWNFLRRTCRAFLDKILEAFEALLEYIPLFNVADDLTELWEFMRGAYSGLNAIIPCDIILEMLLFLFTLYVSYLIIKVSKYLISILLAFVK